YCCSTNVSNTQNNSEKLIVKNVKNIIEENDENFIVNNYRLIDLFFLLYKENEKKYEKIKSQMTKYYVEATQCQFILLTFDQIDEIQSKELYNFISMLFSKTARFRTYKTYSIYNQSNDLRAENYVNNVFRYFFARYYDKYYRNSKSMNDALRNDKNDILNDFITSQIHLDNVLKFFQQIQQYKIMLMENFCSIKEHYEILYKIFLAGLLNINFENNLLMICVDMSCKLDALIDYPKILLDTIDNTGFVFKAITCANLTEKNMSYEIILKKMVRNDKTQEIKFEKLDILRKSQSCSKFYIMNTHSVSLGFDYQINTYYEEFYYCKIYNEKNIHDFISHYRTPSFININFKNYIQSSYYTIYRMIKHKLDQTIHLYYIVVYRYKQKHLQKYPLLFITTCIYKKKNEEYIIDRYVNFSTLENFFCTIYSTIQDHECFPYYDSIRLILDDFKFKFGSKEEKIKKFITTKADLIKNIMNFFTSKTVNKNNIYYLPNEGFIITSDFRLKFFKFTPYQNIVIKDTIQQTWKSVSSITKRDLEKMLQFSLILQLKHDDSDNTFNFYIKVELQKHTDLITSKRLEWFSNIEKKFNKNFNSVFNIVFKKIKKRNKIKCEKTKEQLKKLFELFLEDYSKIKHFLCMNDLTLRLNFCMQIVLKYLITNFDKLDTNKKLHYENKLTKYLTKSNKISMINKMYHSNAFILEPHQIFLYNCAETCSNITVLSVQKLQKNIIYNFPSWYKKNQYFSKFIKFLSNLIEDFSNTYYEDNDLKLNTYSMTFYFPEIAQNEVCENIITYIENFLTKIKL
ncbi:hypothetical protein COBT_001463, partial [Conglomerata obtusa]